MLLKNGRYNTNTETACIFTESTPCFRDSMEFHKIVCKFFDFICNDFKIRYAIGDGL